MSVCPEKGRRVEGMSIAVIDVSTVLSNTPWVDGVSLKDEMERHLYLPIVLHYGS